jgi:hypothetical protein
MPPAVVSAILQACESLCEVSNMLLSLPVSEAGKPSASHSAKEDSNPAFCSF